MGKAKIINGIWTRNVPKKWENHGKWRTDIFKSVLADPRLQQVRYVLADNQVVMIPAGELRRVLVGGPDHYFDRKIWGLFNIDPKRGTVDGQKVQMETST